MKRQATQWEKTFANYKFNIGTVSVAAAAAKSLQSCPTLCDPIDGSPPGSPVPGILQARTLEWVAISFSKELYLEYINISQNVIARKRLNVKKNKTCKRFEKTLHRRRYTDDK